jgi:hypothetical protein
MARTFKYYYDIFIADVEDRDNFRESHRLQVEMLADLCVERDKLKTIIDECGYTFFSEGRNGRQEKRRPEVDQYNKVISEIRAYSRMLGLLLVKDNGIVEESDEWD